jgi:thiol-disulfide isomerase/thioredoxin
MLAMTISLRNLMTFVLFSSLVWPTLAPVELMAQVDRNTDQARIDRIKLLINYAPLQKGVDVDRPTEADLKNCRLESSTQPAGYTVRDSSGRVLRKFLDTDGDKKLDYLSYFKGGVEVYREIDSKGKGKPQEFRWLGQGGTRWGFDRDADGKIDEWKRIGVEEVVNEVFEAIKTKDKARFTALLLTADELDQLKLGDVLAKEVKTRWQKAHGEFESFCTTQTEINPSAEFVNATSGILSSVAAEAYGNSTDLLFYDHSSAVFKNSKQDFGNLAIGTVIYLNDGKWRLIELPELAATGKPIANGNVFFPAAEAAPIAATQPKPEIVVIHDQLDSLDKKIKATEKAAEVANFWKSKAELLEQLIFASEDGEQRTNAVMYAADSIVNAFQEDRYPDALKFLDGMSDRLKAKDVEGLDYVAWRVITGRYNYVNLKGNSEDRDKAHEKWLADLMQFQKDFPNSINSAEALCYLGVNFDNEGKEKEAIEWYREAATRFADTNYGKRARGALTRLDALGEKIEFSGQDLQGKKFSLQDEKWRGKVVVIHFWESWCAEGMEEIQRLAEKYKNDVVFVGCNIEAKTEDFEAYLQKNPGHVAWLQLHAPGSIESSPLAQQLGVPSLPLVMIVNKKGELVEPVVVFGELDRQIERQRRK